MGVFSGQRGHRTARHTHLQHALNLALEVHHIHGVLEVNAVAQAWDVSGRDTWWSAAMSRDDSQNWRAAGRASGFLSIAIRQAGWGYGVLPVHYYCWPAPMCKLQVLTMCAASDEAVGGCAVFFFLFSGNWWSFQGFAAAQARAAQVNVREPYEPRLGPAAKKSASSKHRGVNATAVRTLCSRSEG